MTTQTQVSNKTMSTSLTAAANIVALAGAGLVGYGLMFLIRNFNGFTELGLTAAAVGGTPDQIMAFSENLYHYISHLQVALSGFIIALGWPCLAFGAAKLGRSGLLFL